MPGLVPALPNKPPMHRYGGRIASTRELRLDQDADLFTVTGSGTVAKLPLRPRGTSISLQFTGAPTFANSTHLVCPAGVNFTVAAGDMVMALSQGSGVWNLFYFPGVSGATTQVGPTSGTITGPFAYNTINVTHQNAVATNGGSSSPWATDFASGFFINTTTGGANLLGFVASLQVQLNHTLGNSDTPSADKIGVAIQCYSNCVESGGAGLYGANPAVWIGSGGSMGHVVAAENECAIFTGGSGARRVGLRLHSEGNNQGSTLDAALTIVSNSSCAWQNGILFGEDSWSGNQFIATGGNLVSAYSAFTVANVLNLSNVTVTGDILNFANAQLTGAGALNLGQNKTPNSGVLLTVSPNTDAALPSLSGAVAQFGQVDGTGCAVTFDVFSNASTANNTCVNLIARKANGTLSSPSALKNGDLIGALAFKGHDGTNYDNSDSCEILSFAAQDFTTSHHGSYLTFNPIPTGATTSVAAMQVGGGAGGVQIGSGSDQGLGTLNVVNGIYLGTVGGGTVGGLSFANATSGSIKLTPTTGALGSSVLTLPAATDTVAVLAATQTLTNKTLGATNSLPPAAAVTIGANASSGNVASIANTHNTSGDHLLDMGVGPNSSDTSSAFIRFFDSGANTQQGAINRNGSGAVAYATSSDIRGKPNRELLSVDLARSIVDRLRIWDFDKDGNAIRGVGVIAQEAYEVLPSMVCRPNDPDAWWSAEKAAPVPYLVANMQLVNRQIEALMTRMSALDHQSV